MVSVERKHVEERKKQPPLTVTMTYFMGLRTCLGERGDEVLDMFVKFQKREIYTVPGVQSERFNFT